MMREDVVVYFKDSVGVLLDRRAFCEAWLASFTFGHCVSKHYLAAEGWRGVSRLRAKDVHAWRAVTSWLHWHTPRKRSFSLMVEAMQFGAQVGSLEHSSSSGCESVQRLS